jgi:methionyl-tRNA formyltransferase
MRWLNYVEHMHVCNASSLQEAFLSALRDMSPDLCVTAAYGNILPQKFLDIPHLGTLNVHPSLLPKYVMIYPQESCANVCKCPVCF